MAEQIIKKTGELPINKVSGEVLLNMIMKVLADKEVAKKVSANLMACTSTNPALRQCETGSLISCALMANSLNLSLAQGLGFCAIVPYKNTRENTSKGQFQLQYKGLIQLAIRSGYYQAIDVKNVYEGQLVGLDEFGNELFDFSVEKKGQPIGYFAYFVLNNGFKKTLYMSNQDVIKHATRYSKAYNSDQKYGSKTSLWSTDIDLMGRKTVLKQLLSHYGVLSIELQNAIQYDQSVGSKNADGSYDYDDNANNKNKFFDEEDVANDNERENSTVKNKLAKDEDNEVIDITNKQMDIETANGIDDEETPF